MLKSLGNLTIASKSLGCTRATLNRWLAAEGLKDLVAEARNQRLDFAESQLDKRMQKGDTTAIIFFLKTQGKSRGYQQADDENTIRVQVEGFEGLKRPTNDEQ